MQEMKTTDENEDNVLKEYEHVLSMIKNVSIRPLPFITVSRNTKRESNGGDGSNGHE